jgi:hypothetical protein
VFALAVSSQLEEHRRWVLEPLSNLDRRLLQSFELISSLMLSLMIHRGVLGVLQGWFCKGYQRPGTIK